MLLSKSQYVQGLQCHKSLWLRKNKHEVTSKDDDRTKSLFETGRTVGDYAKQLFPGGIEIEFSVGNFDEMISKTSDLIKNDVKTIYEATFKEKGVFAMADILHEGSKGWDIYEVKASTETKQTYIDDAAIQYYAISNVIKINKVYIVHINNKYVRQGDLDIKSLLSIDNITDDVLALQDDIQSNLKEMNTMLESDMPDIDIGVHCSSPYECEYTDHCWSHIPSPSVFDLYRMRSKKKFELYSNGVVTFEDIPSSHKLNSTQMVQVNSSINNSVAINHDIIKDFLDEIEYPVSFFDFETFQNAIPRFDQQRPYMQMPFQYSLHIVNKSGDMSHAEYLGDENIDPRRELAEKMLNDLPKTGSIVAYNQSFEIMVIKELAKTFTDLSDELNALTDRFIDLIVPFRKLGYYHPDFNGSFSIKSVLPVLFPDDPELDYKKLKIQNGGMAMDTFANLYLLKDPGEREGIRDSLLAYCHLDTLAMVRIWEKLRDVVT